MKKTLLILTFFNLCSILANCQNAIFSLNMGISSIDGKILSYDQEVKAYYGMETFQELRTTIKNKYDSFGLLIESITYDKDGFEISKSIYFYDSLKQLIKITNLPINREEESKKSKKVKTGIRTKKVSFNTPTLIETIYKYDLSGNRIESRSLFSENLVQTSYYNYDSKGNLIKEQIYPMHPIKSKQKVYMLCINEYDETNKKVLSKLYKNSSLEGTSTFEYDNQGNLIKSYTNYESGERSILENKYTDQGNYIEEQKIRFEATTLRSEIKLFNIVYLDQSPPIITINSPIINTDSINIVYDNSLIIEGEVADYSGISSLLINKKEIPVSSDGKFHEEIPLNLGKNLVYITASDKRNNAETKVLTIERILPTEVETLSTNIINIDDYKTDKNFALIIGVNEYIDNNVIDLKNPISDATRLLNTLTDYYTFYDENIIFLKNPSRSDIINTLDQLKYKIIKDDNFLIFYAGHGNWDDKANQGYWLPSDATQFSTANWIRNTTIQEYLVRIEAKHTLIISDACFAGSIFVTRKAFNDSDIGINKLYSLPSRKAMTSGTFKEVPDKSVFLEFLIKRLQQNQKIYISSGELFSSFRNAVLNNSPNVPQFGVIQDSGDEGGDFIFIKK